jgi:hypothetical protein
MDGEVRLKPDTTEEENSRMDGEVRLKPDTTEEEKDG